MTNPWNDIAPARRGRPAVTGGGQPAPSPSDAAAPSGAPVAPDQQIALAPPVAAPVVAVPEGAAADQLQPAGQTDVASQHAQRRAIAAILTFLVVVVGLWAMLAYLNDLTDTLASINELNGRVETQMAASGEGLKELSAKTGYVEGMTADTAQLAAALGGLNEQTQAMTADVVSLNATMMDVAGTLSGLGGTVDNVGQTTGSVQGSLGEINTQISSTVGKAAKLRTSLTETSQELTAIPTELQRTTDRLTYINETVCTMGRVGVQNRLTLRIRFIGINTGTADINATMIPPGGWTC